MAKHKKSLVVQLNITNVLIFLVLLTTTIIFYIQLFYIESSNFRLSILNDTENNIVYLIEDKQKHIALHPNTFLSILESNLENDSKRDLIEDMIDNSPDLYGIIQINENHITTDIYPYKPNIIGYNIVENDLLSGITDRPYFTNLVSDSIYNQEMVYYVLPYEDGYLLFAHKLGIAEIIESYHIDLDKYDIKVIDNSNKVLYSSNGDYILDLPIPNSTRTYMIGDEEIELNKFIDFNNKEKVYLSSPVQDSTWTVKVSADNDFIFGASTLNFLYLFLFLFVVIASFLTNYFFIKKNLINPLQQLSHNMSKTKEDLTTNITTINSNYKILHSLENSFISMKEAVIERDKSLREFTYVASHDLQEPLRMITSYINILEMEYMNIFDEDGKKYLNYITDGAIRMKDLIIDLLHYSRSDQIDLNEEIDLNLLLNDLISSMGYLDNNIVKMNIQDLPTVRGNSTGLKQVFQNLITNSIKFNNQFPVINIYSENQKIFIEDNGIGMDEKYVDKIFAPFQRLNSGNKYEGSGIGLSIVKKVVEKHGWKISVETKIGEGTKFIINMEE